jgi:hypothetical protein
MLAPDAYASLRDTFRKGDVSVQPLGAGVRRLRHVLQVHRAGCATMTRCCTTMTPPPVHSP